MSVTNILEKRISDTQEKYPEIFEGKASDLKDGHAFMLLSLELLFKDWDFQDIEDGIVDSSYRQEIYDYGIDAIYIAANGEKISSLEDLVGFNDDTKFVMHIFQFKKGKGIDLAEILKFKEGIQSVLIDEKIEEDKNLYMFNLVEDLNKVKEKLFETFPSKNIEISINIVFGGVKSILEKDQIIMPHIQKMKKTLEENGYINHALEIIDAQSIIDLSKDKNDIVDIVTYKKTFKYITDTNDDNKLTGYIAIIGAEEVAQLVKKWQSRLFEANIRDFYKKNEINSKITYTCSSESESQYFWSYNNGLTITCRKVEELPNDKYRLHGIQVVNGCQTSNAIYAAFKNSETIRILDEKIQSERELSHREKTQYEFCKNQCLNLNTNLLVKIIETNNNDLIYKITETTNSQTPIKKFSLKANENIQQNIEEYLKQFDIFYDRRINFYKNQGKKNTISIQKLFQLFYSQILYKPTQARQRPKQLFDSEYDKIFPTDKGQTFDFKLYLIPVLIDAAIGKKIRELQRDKTTLDAFEFAMLSNCRLHLGPFLLHSIVGSYAKPALIKKFETIKSALMKKEDLDNHFAIAVGNFKKILASQTSNSPRLISVAIKKRELDEKIVRFIRHGSSLPK